jgi:hypothetical protein
LGRAESYDFEKFVAEVTDEVAECETGLPPPACLLYRLTNCETYDWLEEFVEWSEREKVEEQGQIGIGRYITNSVNKRIVSC